MSPADLFDLFSNQHFAVGVLAVYLGNSGFVGDTILASALAHFCRYAADLVRVRSLPSTRKLSLASRLLKNCMVLTYFASKTSLVSWLPPWCLWVAFE